MTKGEIQDFIKQNVNENHQGLITGNSLKATLLKMLDYIESVGGSGGGGDNPPVTSKYTFIVTAGTNGSVAIQGYEGTNVTVDARTTLTIKAIANSGYKFKQWSDGNTNSTRSVIVDSDMSLHATFEVESAPTYTKTFTVEFMSGSEVFKTVIESVSYTGTIQPTTTNITIPADVPEKPNYTFSGWYKNAQFTGDQYTAGMSVTVSDGDKFYANFEENATQLTKTFRVIFNYNYTDGGSTTETYYKTYMSNESEPQTMTITLPTVPTRSGYTFKGWSLSPTATSGTVSGNFTIHDDDTLYAVWQANAPVGYTIYDLFSDAVPYTSENVNELSGLLAEHTGITGTYTTPVELSYSYYLAIPADATLENVIMDSGIQSPCMSGFVHIGDLNKGGKSYKVYLHDNPSKPIRRKYIITIS